MLFVGFLGALGWPPMDIDAELDCVIQLGSSYILGCDWPSTHLSLQTVPLQYFSVSEVPFAYIYL